MNTAQPPSFKSGWQRAIGESDLPSTTRLVLLTLSVHFMDEQGGHCFPSIENIMRVTGMANRPVIHHLHLAVEAGWLTRWHFGKTRANRRWNYRAILPTEIVTESHHQPAEIVTESHHKPCEDITMPRERNHARVRPREAVATVAVSATAPARSLKEKKEEKKPRMTKLTDAVIEKAQKTVRQRGIREDLSNAALRHSIEKCRMRKGYCEMTEAAWIETVVHWVGKERYENPPNMHSATFSPSTPIVPIPTPEEIARQNAAYEARMAAADAQHRQRLAGYHAAARHHAASHATESPVRPIDPVQAVQALAAKVRRGATAPPAPPIPRPLDPQDAQPARRPPLTAERRDALNPLLQAMHRSGCAPAELNQVYQGVQEATEETWLAVIAQARQRLVAPGPAVTR